jgi:aspartate beta-hydroxylase
MIETPDTVSATAQMRQRPSRDPASMAVFRGAWTTLIESLAARGESEMARELCETAVRHGVWNDPLQRPGLHFVPTAPAIPILDAGAFWFTSLLEDAFPRIRAEVDAVTDAKRYGFMPVEQQILAYGRWEQVVFYDNGVRFQRPAGLFPAIANTLDEINQRMPLPGLASLLFLAPGSRVAAHCGHTNSRLRVHLGVSVPEGAGLRVRDRIVTWQEGKVLVFDDSFEHEVWNHGKTARIILLFDILNPAVPDAFKAEDDLLQRSFDDKARAFMTESNLKRIERRQDPEGVTAILDDATVKVVARYLRHAGVKAVELRGGEVFIEYGDA